MKLSPKLRRNLIVGSVVFGLVATPSFALFGLGDIVFDPTSYASLVSQLSQMETQYNMLKTNLTHFSFKQAWTTERAQLTRVPFGNVFGETNGMDAALTSNNPSTAQAAWQNSTEQVDSNATTYLTTQTAGGAARSQLAMVESTDATSTACLNAVGAYNAAASANVSAESDLQSSQLDDDDDTNTEVQQLNLVNAAQAQQLVEMKQQGMLHACLAQQMATANMQQRNAAAHDLNTWGFVAQQQQTNNAMPTGGSTVWTTYLP